MARLSATMINILELHDARHKTRFLRDYDATAATNRLGKVGAVNCVDCHGDNITGNLQSPRPGVTGYDAVRAKPFAEAVHSVHARVIRMPDKAGRTQNCQACHPTHNGPLDPPASPDGVKRPRLSSRPFPPQEVYRN